MAQPMVPYEAETWAYRELFPHCREGVVYLDHAATGPLPSPVVEKVLQYYQRRQAGHGGLEWEVEVAERARELIAQLIGAPSAASIAFMPNTTTGLAVFALSLPWKPGDVVLLGEQEFPANVYPWRALQRFGVELRFVPMADGRLPLERLAAVWDDAVRVVALSAVQFLSGYRAELEAIGEFCRSRGALLVVDGMQAVGAVRVDVQRAHIAALACGGAKWLLAPHGTGFLYVAPEFVQELSPALLGWLAAEDPWNFFAFDQPLVPTARRFEGGSLNFPGIVGLAAALELLFAYGPERAQERVLALSGLLWQRLAERLPEVELITPAEPARRAGIVTLRLPTAEMARRLVEGLAQRRIRCSLRLDCVRFSPHWYNTAEEVEYTAAVVAELLSSSD